MEQLIKSFKERSLKKVAIIPARYQSTRFPGKPLVDINGKSMISRVYDNAIKSKLFDEVIVATDDKRIFEVIRDFGGLIYMTSPNHISGTDRIAEVVNQIDADLVYNIQGDEPFLEFETLKTVVDLSLAEGFEVGSLYHEINVDDYSFNPNQVKVVLNNRHEAMYFSRAAIPFNRVSGDIHYKKHIGIYAFRKDVLLKLVELSPSPLELTEQLEQLRWLENGYSIKMAKVNNSPISIDTPQDLEFAIKNLSIKK